jgi:hypothetical protein
MFRRSIGRLLLALLIPAVARPAPESLVLGEGGPPPVEVPSPVRPALAATGLRIERGQSKLATFWPRRDLPLAASTPDGSPVLAERVGFSQVPPATLLAVVRFDRPWLDYRDREMPAGIYTMRYAVQPAIKEHRGVSKYRDFAILTPVALDLDLDRSLPETVAASLQAFGRGHPAVLAIFPIRGALSEPKIEENEMGQPLLAVRIGAIAMGFVLGGHGRVDGST